MMSRVAADLAVEVQLINMQKQRPNEEIVRKTWVDQHDDDQMVFETAQGMRGMRQSCPKLLHVLVVV